ncbi:chorismate mutase [Sulfitobacter sp. EhC04]|uniref:chorismate mutase n=1 Tax=Sulfitobacter sp. EhC04 TaxID=1849168 RepID=UPI0007F46E72|nr:chorismate mutase [Sulfitobacter sp. EhC04]OAN75608.1 chorismate mutase [Sulfitobacter sp. EhC04]
MDTLAPPETCQSMAQLREQIDAIDVELISLLVIRSHYIDRAVDLKKIDGLPARTTDRVGEVLQKVSATATNQGLDPDLAVRLWAELIEWSIQREIKELGV